MAGSSRAFASAVIAAGLFAAGAGLLPARSRAQGAPSAAPHRTTVPGPTVVTVAGDVPHPMKLSAADLADMPRRVVRAPAEHGHPAATYAGVLLRDVVARAGAPLGGDLRGPALAMTVLCSASDGYRVVFALAELDSAFTDRTILLADRKDGQPLPPEEGPYRLVIPADARPARWIRNLAAITVRRGATPD